MPKGANFPDKMHAMWQVLSVFAAAPDLVNMLREVETAYDAMLNQQPGWMDSPYAEFLPFISEQARDWENAATVDNTGSSPTQVAFCLGHAKIVRMGDAAILRSIFCVAIVLESTSGSDWVFC